MFSYGFASSRVGAILRDLNCIFGVATRNLWSLLANLALRKTIQFWVCLQRSPTNTWRIIFLAPPLLDYQVMSLEPTSGHSYPPIFRSQGALGSFPFVLQKNTSRAAAWPCPWKVVQNCMESISWFRVNTSPLSYPSIPQKTRPSCLSCISSGSCPKYNHSSVLG